MAQKVVDITEVIDRCLKPVPIKAVTATQVKNYVENAHYSVYCDFHESRDKKDPPSNYTQRLWDDGKEHEEQCILKKYPNATKIDFDIDKLEDGFVKCLNEMFKGTDVISNAPLIHYPDGMKGTADVLEKKDGKSDLGDYHYVVKEIKIAKDLKEHHKMQGAFYNHILGRIQGNPPDTFYLINGEGKEEDFPFS